MRAVRPVLNQADFDPQTPPDSIAETESDVVPLVAVTEDSNLLLCWYC